MQFNTFVSSIRDLERCANAPNLHEILLEPTLLARQGKLSQESVYALAIEAKKRGLRPVLVWDIVMPEQVMVGICDRLKNWDISSFEAIRVCDPGAAYWLLNHFPLIPLQLIVETGNHNLESLRGWCELFSPSLERLVLSIELPQHKLIEYCQTLPVDCEILGVGQILLFYSPRSLLAQHLSITNEDWEYIETTATFEDAKDRHFPILETAHGTFMFLDKDQFILDRLATLQSAGLHTVSLDLRHLVHDGDVAVDIDLICQQIAENPTLLRTTWTKETRAPFFNANRTTAIFPRMKSKLSNYRNNACLAEVLAGEKGKYVVFYTLRPFDISQIRRLIVPTGEEIELTQKIAFRNLNGKQLNTFDSDQILVTDWIKKAVPSSLLMGNIMSG